MESDRLLNMRSNVLHRYPAFESCNVDAIPLTKRLMLAPDSIPPNVRYCKRCFKDA